MSSISSSGAVPDASLLFMDGFPVECRAVDIGGGRGVFVTQDLRAGSVAFAEEPLLCVQEGALPWETTYAAVARHILQSDRCSDILEKIRGLHPQQLSDFPPDTLQEARKKLSAPAAQLARLALLPFTPEDALLLLLKVQLNAFDSGVFLKLAMVNHACHPNCMVFAPGELRRNSTAAGPVPSSHSRLVATRALRAGEEVTISFVGSGRSEARCAVIFERKHLCRLMPGSALLGTELEAVAAGIDEGPLSQQALAQLEDQLDCRESKEKLELAVGGLCSGPAAAMRELKEVEALQADSARLLHPRHVVLARVHRLVARAAGRVLAYRSDADVAEQLLRASSELRATQALYMADTHWDLIETCDLIALGIEALLSCNRDRLFATFPQTYGDFGAASHALMALRKEAAAIFELYAVGSEEWQGTTETVSNEATRTPKPAPPAPCLAACRKAASEDWSIFD